jgi:hypothetical protein
VLESGDIAPRILWPRHYVEVSGHLQAPAALSRGKSPCYSLNRRLGGPQSRSGRSGEEKNSQLPPGIEIQNPDRPARNPDETYCCSVCLQTHYKYTISYYDFFFSVYLVKTSFPGSCKARLKRRLCPPVRLHAALSIRYRVGQSTGRRKYNPAVALFRYSYYYYYYSQSLLVCTLS